MNLPTGRKVDPSEASYLGIEGKTITQDITQLYGIPTGVGVVAVEQGSPAEKAGIQQGDVITQFDGRAVANQQQLSDTLQYYKAGETVDVTLQENCGRNEANFVYRSSINGRTEEHHLCQACAEKLGYTRNFFDQRPSLTDSFFGNNGFFDSMPSLMGRMLESPFDDFFDKMPAIGAGPVREVPMEKKEDLMSDENQSRFSYLRQMNALKLAQKKAIHEEDFERAAELRDEIRELEEAHKEAKENKKDDEDGHKAYV